MKSMIASRVSCANAADGKPHAVYIYADGKNGRKQVTLGVGFTEDGGNLEKVLNSYMSAKALSPPIRRSISCSNRPENVTRSWQRRRTSSSTRLIWSRLSIGLEKLS
jgi:hypothetical protein